MNDHSAAFLFSGNQQGHPVRLSGKILQQGADFSLKNLMVSRGDCLSEAYQRYALSLSRQIFFGTRVEYWPENLLVSGGLIFLIRRWA